MEKNTYTGKKNRKRWKIANGDTVLVVLKAVLDESYHVTEEKVYCDQ